MSRRGKACFRVAKSEIFLLKGFQGQYTQDSYPESCISNGRRNTLSLSWFYPKSLGPKMSGHKDEVGSTGCLYTQSVSSSASMISHHERQMTYHASFTAIVFSTFVCASLPSSSFSPSSAGALHQQLRQGFAYRSAVFLTLTAIDDFVIYIVQFWS